MMSSSNRIFKNTMFLYVQMIIGVIIGLYTSRVILNVLGVNDFGLFNVVAGVVTMFGIINSAMTSSTSRFLTFEIGKGNEKELRSIFSNSLSIHLFIAILIVIISIGFGPWFIKNQMQIDINRIDAAEFVFYTMLASLFINIAFVPYGSAIIAHEKMSIFAVFSIIDSILKLIIVFLIEILPYDKLKGYGMLLLISQIIIQSLYVFYCLFNIPESRITPKYDKNQFNKLLNFAGWSLFGDGAVLLYTQGVNILLNIFFGTTVNAARGITVQVQGMVMRLVGGFQTALNPQITKSYATNDLKFMHKLIFSSSKFSFYLLLIITIPLFIETEYLLKIWLGNIPVHTVSFIRFMLGISLLDSLANPLVFAAKATGKIKLYQSILGTILLLILPTSYVFLKFGYPPETVYLIHLVFVIIGQFFRVYLLKDMIKLSFKSYFNNIITPCFYVLLITAPFTWISQYLFENSIIKLITICSVSLVSCIFSTYLFGTTKEERIFLLNKIPILNRN
ncbi:oligosaccharide flippase family protein [Sphingobacterium kyonggiense]|uniref:Oligosaccharide flippase family protein n=1 Tax=Sphingobacterium kyonggiense TaxID=714075 RepID=A0ABP7YVK8_9SPHI